MVRKHLQVISRTKNDHSNLAHGLLYCRNHSRTLHLEVAKKGTEEMKLKNYIPPRNGLGFRPITVMTGTTEHYTGLPGGLKKAVGEKQYGILMKSTIKETREYFDLHVIELKSNRRAKR